MKQVIKKNRNVLISISTLIILTLLWELTLTLFNISKIVLIKPSAIIERLYQDRDIIFEELFYTITEIIPGWIIGNGLGFLLALLIYRKKNFSSYLIKSSVLINSIPLIALTAILGGIMGTDKDLKIVIVSILVFFPIFITTLCQLNTIDENHKDLMYSYSATDNEILFKILLPKSLPFILNCIKVSVVTAIFTAITAEFFGGYGGIGIFILSKKGLFNLELVWASIFAIAIFGSFFYFSVEFLQKKLTPWHRS
jgi:NitT/TauT family transport system permease protein